ncbi:MAG: glycosyltransferase family 39 protein, partial [bacterium]
LIVVVYILLRINIVGIPLDRDEGLFAYAGQVILRGGLPYLDVLEMKPPLVFYLNALALRVFPPTPTGIHLFLHIYNFLTLIVLFFVGKIFMKSRAAGLWTAFIYAIFSSLPSIQGFTASTEMFLLLPISLSFLFILLVIDRDKGFFSFLSGVSGALAFWIRPTGALILFVLFIFLLLSQAKFSLKRKIELKHLAIWLLGFLLISLIIVGYFIARNLFYEFVFWCFVYPYYYGKGANIWAYFFIILKRLGWLLEGNLILFLLLFFGLVVAVLKKNNSGYFLFGFLFFSLLAVVPGFAYPHYFAQLAPAIALSGAFALVAIIDLIKTKKSRLFFSFLFALVIFMNPILVHFDYYFKLSADEISRYFFHAQPFPESVPLGQFIAEQTTKNDKVFIFGAEPQILVYADRESVSPFASGCPFVSDAPLYEVFYQKVWRDVSLTPPKYFVVFPFYMRPRSRLDDWLARCFEQLLADHYDLEAIMSVEFPRGKLTLFATLNDVQKKSFNGQALIFIFKRRGP